MPAGRRHPFQRERLRYDAVFRAEVAYCYEKGIPHSFYLGGPHTWSSDDRDKAKAYALERATECSSCGTAPWEWEADPQAYVPMVEVCMGCYHRESQRDEATRPGSTIALVPRERAAKMKAAPRRAPRRAR